MHILLKAGTQNHCNCMSTCRFAKASVSASLRRLLCCVLPVAQSFEKEDSSESFISLIACKSVSQSVSSSLTETPAVG